MINNSVIQWLETELSYLEDTLSERSLSLQMDLKQEAFAEAVKKEKELLKITFSKSDDYHSFEMFYKYEINDNG